MADRREQGIHARNREFSGYEQVRKDQDYGLSDVDEQDAFDEDYEIRICDMRELYEGGEAGAERFARELGEALENIGFAILINHGIDTRLYDAAEAKVRELFETTAREQRLRYEAERVGSVNQGYFPLKETSEIHPDLVEGWVFCRRAFNIDGDDRFEGLDFWPKRDLEPTFRRLCQAQEALIHPIMQSVLRYLGCDPHHFDERLTGTNFGLRLNYYPPVTAADDASGAGRLLGHEDVDLFTLLPAPKEEGLQVLNRANMRWIRLQAPPGSIILNTGDYMQRITNDRLPSTTHRVGKPRDPEQRSHPRVSFPMNVYLWENETLEVLPCCGEPKYAPIKAINFHTRITSKYYGDDYAVDAAASEPETVNNGPGDAPDD